MFCFSINTPVCCMYFASSNINLATYFSLTCSRLLKLLLGSTLDSPTPSGPPKFEASSKRAAQPTSWSQRLTRLRTWHLRPNSELNRDRNKWDIHNTHCSHAVWTELYPFQDPAAGTGHANSNQTVSKAMPKENFEEVRGDQGLNNVI